MQMSDYLLSIDRVSKKRYLKRLELLGLTEKDDPYLEDNQLKRFLNRMSAWPQIEYGHIFGYCIKKPDVYSQPELLDWKNILVL